jgi:hypothetical protein
MQGYLMVSIKTYAQDTKNGGPEGKQRQEIEGVFGVAKTRYGLDKLMTKLPDSQIASIGLVFFVMNLRQILSFTRFFETLEMLVLTVDFNETEFVFVDESPLF